MTALYLALTVLTSHFVVGLGFMRDLRRWRRGRDFEWLARKPLNPIYFLRILALWPWYALSVLHRRWHGWFPAWAPPETRQGMQNALRVRRPVKHKHLLRAILAAAPGILGVASACAVTLRIAPVFGVAATPVGYLVAMLGAAGSAALSVSLWDLLGDSL
jgi:hypothetical protein